MEDIYKFALEFEKKNRKFYEDFAKETDNEQLKSVFEELAAEEKKHEDIVKELAEDRNVKSIQTNIIPKAKQAFDMIAQDFKDSGIMPEGQVDIYKKAKDLEIKSKNFYNEQAEKTDNDTVKQVFKELAEEEQRHENILDNIITMVNRPNTWLEDAEWYHLEDY